MKTLFCFNDNNVTKHWHFAVLQSTFLNKNVMNDMQITNALKPMSSHRHIFQKDKFGTQFLRVCSLPKLCASTARLFILVNQFLTSSPVVFSASSGQFSIQSSNCWRVNPEQLHSHHPQVKSPSRQQLLLSLKWDYTWVRLMSINPSLFLSLSLPQ